MAETRRKRKGIMGGTFDPIHIGHLILGENAYRQFHLDSVLFMPCGNPPHKAFRPGCAQTDQRVEMVRLAIADNPHFELSLAETHDQGYTYTKNPAAFDKRTSGYGLLFYYGCRFPFLFPLLEWASGNLPPCHAGGCGPGSC